MAEEIIAEADISADGHDEMPFRLGDIVLEKEFADLHPLLRPIDQIRHEWKFQFKLLRNEWGQPHVMTMFTGIAAFLLGAVSAELFVGGDPKVTGIDGLAGIGGFAFFQLIVSAILWVWFFVQLSVNFPVMRGHMINVIIIWSSIFLSQVVLHVNSPSFPIGANLGDALGGVMLSAVGCFFTYFFWKAVTETRDFHVQEHHVHTDVRVMEEAMAEHSLFAWTIMVIVWVFTMMLNGWSGAHFIADRNVSDYAIYSIHLISGVFLIFLLMHMLWFPQRMLGEGARVQTKAAAAADADLLIEGVVLASEGECPSCEASAPISQNEKGETILDCASEDCNSRGVAGETCEGCGENYPTRYTCTSCGINSPAIDFIPDKEAW
tara:strand:- start:74 stop:1207 length:1134 start_codon:yes stop_codon:yes gene_type:complete